MKIELIVELFHLQHDLYLTIRQTFQQKLWVSQLLIDFFVLLFMAPNQVKVTDHEIINTFYFYF